MTTNCNKGSHSMPLCNTHTQLAIYIVLQISGEGYDRHCKERETDLQKHTAVN